MATVADPSVGIAAGTPQPFAIGFGAVNSHPNNLVSTAITVPAGIRWTIQNISVVCFVPNGISISSFNLTTSVNGVVTGISPTVTEGRFFSNTPYSRAVVQLSQPTLTYADPGTPVAFQAFLQTTAPTNEFSCAADLIGSATGTTGSPTNASEAMRPGHNDDVAVSGATPEPAKGAWLERWWMDVQESVKRAE